MALTRARDGLVLMRARLRVGEATQWSRFVAELPSEALVREDDANLVRDARIGRVRAVKRLQGRLFE